MTKALLILSLLTLLNGCCSPGPWKAERFESGLPLGSMVTPESNEDLAPYFIGDDYLQILVPAVNETTHSGSSPYYVLASIGNREDSIDAVKVYSVKITVNDVEVDNYTLEKCTGAGENDGQVVSTPFSLESKNYRGWGVAFCSSPIDIEYEQAAYMAVEVDLEVFHADSVVRKTVVHKFYPEVKRGLLSCAEV